MCHLFNGIEWPHFNNFRTSILTITDFPYSPLSRLSQFFRPENSHRTVGCRKKYHSTLWPFCQLRPADQYKIIQQVHIHYVIPNAKKNYEISSHHPEFACFFRVQRPGGSKNLKQITQPWASKFSQDPATSKEFLQKQKGLRSFLPFILASWLSLTL